MLGHAPLGTIPLGTLPSGQTVQTTTRTFRFATRSFSTRATDSPAHDFIPGRIIRGLRLSRRVSSAPDGQLGGLMETDYGVIDLANNDGELDSLVNQYAADGRTVRLKLGATEIDSGGREKVKAYSTFATVYTTVAGPWLFEHDVVRLRLSSFANRLQNRLQTATYAGTGGEEGGSDLAGRTKPTALGRCPHIPAQLVDPTILTYQLHSGSMDGVIAVYDAGISVPFDADYGSYAALEAATVPVGEYASSLAAGFIKLGSIPFGQVTADVRGDRDNTSGSYVGTAANIIRMVLRDYGNITTGEIDHDSFTDFATLQPASCGLFLPTGDTSTVIEIVSNLAFQVGGVVGQDRSGLFRILRLDAPGSTADWLLDDRNMVEIERIDLPYGIPWRSWAVGYNVNFAVQDDADLATSVSQSRRQFLQAERRYAYATNTNVALYHASSGTAPTREAFFLTSAEATDEAERLAGLYDFGRALYRVVVKELLFSAEIGQVARITYDRFDLDGGKNFVLVGIEDDADRVETELLCFG